MCVRVCYLSKRAVSSSAGGGDHPLTCETYSWSCWRYLRRGTQIGHQNSTTVLWKEEGDEIAWRGMGWNGRVGWFEEGIHSSGKVRMGWDAMDALYGSGQCLPAVPRNEGWTYVHT